MNDSMIMIITLCEGILKSIRKYEREAKRQGNKQPVCGYGELTREDSKESIKRRITVVREELLKVSQML